MMRAGTNIHQTIMVVDDSPDIRELLRLQLTVLGYRVVEAEDGLQAVGLAEQENPALILMDITMPVMDGLSATRVIRKGPATSNVVIVAFSALSRDEGRERAIAAGCNEFLNKPVSMEQLGGLLNRYLSAH